jgi:hypothetical protein
MIFYSPQLHGRPRMTYEKPDILEILSFRRIKREQIQERLCEYALAITHSGDTESRLRTALNKYLDDRHLFRIKRNQLINLAISKVREIRRWKNFLRREEDRENKSEDKPAIRAAMFLREISKLDRPLPKKTSKVSVKKRSRKGRR